MDSENQIRTMNNNYIPRCQQCDIQKMKPENEGEGKLVLFF